MAASAPGTTPMASVADSSLTLVIPACSSPKNRHAMAAPLIAAAAIAAVRAEIVMLTPHARPSSFSDGFVDGPLRMLIPEGELLRKSVEHRAKLAVMNGTHKHVRHTQR